jgi:hypothetical protein
MKHGAPNIFHANTVSNDISSTVYLAKDGRWLPKRPLGFQGLYLKRRLSLAWKVFTGQYDVLRWSDSDPDPKENHVQQDDKRAEPQTGGRCPFGYDSEV